MSSEQAMKHLSVADHMLKVTYPMVRDPKLLLSVLEHIAKGMEDAIDVFLTHERKWKRIPPYGNTRLAKLTTLRKHAKTYNIDIKDITMLEECDRILSKHKESPMEFTRKESFVICSDDYHLDALTPEKMKGRLQQARAFVDQLLGDLP